MTRREDIITARGYPAATQADELSLKISSYPVSARYLADRLSTKGKSIAELCCGIGISLIEFSDHFEDVIGVDIDEVVVKCARMNIAQAGKTNCQVRTADIRGVDVLKRIQTDIVAYDVPYWSEHGAALTQKNPSLRSVIELVREYITRNLVIYTPPHFPFEDMVGIAHEFEYQEVWINGVHDRNFIYLGALAEYHGRTKIMLKH